MPLDYTLPILAAQSIHLPTPEESQISAIRLQQLKDYRQQQVEQARDRVALQQAYQQNVQPDGTLDMAGVGKSLLQGGRAALYQQWSEAMTKQRKEALDNEEKEQKIETDKNTEFSQGLQGLNAANYQSSLPALQARFPDRAKFLPPTFDQNAIDVFRNANTKHSDYLATVKQANELALDNKPIEGAAMQGRALLDSGAATQQDIDAWVHKWQGMGVPTAFLRNGLTEQAVKALEDASVTPEKQAERAAAEAGRTQTETAQQDLEKLRQAGAERLQGLRSAGQIRLEQLRQSGRLTGPTVANAPLSVADPNAPHGEDYLKTIPATDQPIVKALAEGRQPWPSSMAMRSPQWTRIMQEVFQYDPTLDLATVNNNTRAKVRQDFTSGKSAEQIRALNTLMGHLGRLSDLTEALNNKDFQTYNSIANRLATEFGWTGKTNYDTVAPKVAQELTKAWRGTGGSEKDIERDLGNMNSSMTPAQGHQALGNIADLAQSQIDSMREKYRQGMGTADIQVLSPASQAILDKVESRATGGAVMPKATADGAVTVTGRDGKTYRFPSQAAADAFKKAGG